MTKPTYSARWWGLLLLLACVCAPVASRAHTGNDILVGASISGKLEIKNPERLALTYHMVWRTQAESVGGYRNTYSFDHFNRPNDPQYANEYFNLRALAATENVGGPEPGHATFGSFLVTEVLSLTGPAGATFSFWDEGDYLSGSPAKIFTANASTGNFRFNLSDPEFPDDDPGADHHTRGWTTNTPGTYTIGFRIVDTSDNGPGGAPIHTPSDIYYMTFQAVPEPGTALLLAAGAGGLLLRRHRRLPAKLLLLAAAGLLAVNAEAAYTHFEARQVHPICATPDGARLLAVHSPAAKLAVFDIAGPAATAPQRLAEIPVGLEPVSVRARTADECWVVCEASDAVYIVSLQQQAVTAILPVPDEPADVLFVQDRAFVTCARSQQVRVFDTATRAEVAVIPLAGRLPRAMTASPDGTRLYVAFQHSGNNTTVLSPELAPRQPLPASPGVPEAPRAARIVPATDSRVTWTVQDYDVAEIATGTLEVLAYRGHAGALLFDLAVQPGTGALWVCNTQARNLVRFEPALRGHAIDSRLTRLHPTSGAPTIFDLNPGIDYGELPNATAQATALSQPTAIVFTADGTACWIAAFNSDRLARVSASGVVQQRVDLRPAGQNSSAMRGPRGLALSGDGAVLYVLNKLSDSVSVVHAGSGAVYGEHALGAFSPLPPAVRAGRGFLFDARLSGNGTVSCASCHIDADHDGLAWDLGDPYGAMSVVIGANLSVHDPTPVERPMHPMKGAMLTQTLRGITGGAPFHWRGDRATLDDFNPSSATLLGGEQIAPGDMAALSAYLFSLRNHPNPFRLRTNAFPATLNGGNPARGRQAFNNHELSHCNVCHAGERGSDHNVDLKAEIGSAQSIKTPPLGLVYQRLGFNPTTGAASPLGFGMLHNGTGAVLPIVHPYALDNLTTTQQITDITAYVLAFETGTKPAVGNGWLVQPANRDTGETANELTFLEGQASLGNCDLLVRGRLAGGTISLRFIASTQRYQAASPAVPALTRAEVLAALAEGESLLFLAVPPAAAEALSLADTTPL